MRIVLASSEAVPFSKTGGLADVASALSKALACAGHDVWLVVPFYPQAAGSSLSGIQATGRTVEVPIGMKHVSGTILHSRLPGSNVTVLLIDQPSYFDRPGLYQEDGEDHRDNCERFVFFSRAVVEAARILDLRPDVIHSHDWQTGLIPALLAIEARHTAGFEETAAVFTIHNVAFQGQFWHWDMLLTGIDWKYFNWRQMEFFEHLNLMKTGIVFADMMTTVSPTYAREIQTPEFGCRLHGVLSCCGDDLVGILNGIDTEIWNPETDQALVQNYSVENPAAGKAACKSHLQQLLGLPVNSRIPLFGMISRMTDQKGFDLIAECSEEILGHDLQLCFLGTGDSQYEKMLTQMAQQNPQKVSTTIGFDDELAHKIEAGADAYLMPSRYEPCGLNQMYSMKYGTVPIVRAVGGLADTVVDVTEQTLADGTATGFCFDEYNSEALLRQVSRAVETYHQTPKWAQLIKTGMQQDYSWSRSVAEYVTVYEQAKSNRNATPLGPRQSDRIVSGGAHL